MSCLDILFQCHCLVLLTGYWWCIERLTRQLEELLQIVFVIHHSQDMRGIDVSSK